MRISDWSSDVCSSDLMRILVTRPREDAAGLVTALTARGHAVLLEPLLAIVPRDAVDWPEGHQQAQALLVSSANGVRAFARADSRRGQRRAPRWRWRSEEHTSELQSLMRTSYAVFCLKNT